MNDLITRQSVITMLQKICNSIDDGNGFQLNEWVEYAKDIPAENIDGDLISRKAVLDCIGMTSLHYDLARRLRKLPTIQQTDSVLEDIKRDIEKLPRIKVGNSNSQTVKYCIDERLIYEVFDKHISGKENE